MTDVVYADTNVYLDCVLERRDKFRNMGEIAFLMFLKGTNCAFKLIFSNHIKKEFIKHAAENKIREIIQKFKDKNKLIEVEETQMDWNEAKKLSPDHPDDALHYILAKKVGATILATRNFQHYDFINTFENLSVLHPEAV